MKKLLILALLIMGCAPQPQPFSVLSGQWYIGNTQQITFSGAASGTFVYQKCNTNAGNPYVCASAPNNGCSQTGNWQDLNAGNAVGQVQFVIQFDTCNNYPQGTVITETYSVFNGYLNQLQLPLVIQ
jgi:hypothetical protein